MKKALWTLFGPLVFLALVTGTITAVNQSRNLTMNEAGGAGPNTPGGPDVPLCTPDFPCNPDVPNLQ